VWEDISILIGELWRYRPIKGGVTMAARIPLVEFEQWLKMTIDISPDRQNQSWRSHPVSNLRQKTISSRLTTPSRGKSGHKFPLGYNSRHGMTGRGRDAISDATAESKQIFAILECALTEEAKANTSTTYLMKFSHMLGSRFHTAADVFNLNDYISEDVAVLVRDSMLQDKTNGLLNF
jgi:hypothetical protein